MESGPARREDRSPESEKSGSVSRAALFKCNASASAQIFLFSSRLAKKRNIYERKKRGCLAGSARRFAGGLSGRNRTVHQSAAFPQLYIRVQDLSRNP